MVPRQPVRPVSYSQALSKTSCMTRTNLFLTLPDQDSTKTSSNQLWPSLSPAQAGDLDNGSTLKHGEKRTGYTNEHCPGADSCQESHIQLTGRAVCAHQELHLLSHFQKGFQSCVPCPRVEHTPFDQTRNLMALLLSLPSSPLVFNLPSRTQEPFLSPVLA